MCLRCCSSLRVSSMPRFRCSSARRDAILSGHTPFGRFRRPRLLATGGEALQGGPRLHLLLRRGVRTALSCPAEMGIHLHGSTAVGGSTLVTKANRAEEAPDYRVLVVVGAPIHHRSPPTWSLRLQTQGGSWILDGLIDCSSSGKELVMMACPFSG